MPAGTHAAPPAGFTPPAPPSIDTLSARLFDLADRNDDHVLTRAEFNFGPPGVTPPADAVAHLDALFAKLDANHNGSVSEAEFKAGIAGADANHDGLIQIFEANHAPPGLIGHHPGPDHHI